MTNANVLEHTHKSLDITPLYTEMVRTFHSIPSEGVLCPVASTFSLRRAVLIVQPCEANPVVVCSSPLDELHLYDKQFMCRSLSAAVNSCVTGFIHGRDETSISRARHLCHQVRHNLGVVRYECEAHVVKRLMSFKVRTEFARRSSLLAMYCREANARWQGTRRVRYEMPRPCAYNM